MTHPVAADHRTITVLSGTVACPGREERPEAKAAAEGLAARLRELVEAAGGRPERAPGTGLAAVFGAAHSDEDDPVRAVRAAIALHREAGALSALHGAALELRIGVHTGDVHWPRPGAERTASLREALGVARGLAAAARPGAVLVSRATERAANARIRFRKAHDAEAFEAVGEVETRRDVREEVATPTVGRDTELARLLELFDRRAGGFVLVEGDAGVGKSRLLYEFRRRVAERGVPVLVASGRAHDGPQGPLGVFGDVIRPAAGVTGLEPGDGARVAAWIGEHLQEAIPEAIERENCAHLIALSLGFPLPESRVTHIEPARMRSETHFAWVRWLRALAARQPVVVCLEDLQWADDATHALLESLAAGLAGEPVMFVGSRRPSARTPRGFERMRIEELSREASGRLAEAILRAPVSEELAEFLAQQSGGHPYYLEELARYFVEAGLVSGSPLRLQALPTGLPEGLHGLLVARIESLGPEDREVLKAASVVGRTFWAGLLERAMFRKVERALERARRRQIVVARPRSLIPGDQELAFRHALLRDAAYSMLTAGERTRLHRVVADQLGEHVRDGGRRVKVLIAAHREASGQKEEPARLWAEAADEALRESSYAEALEQAREALRLGRGPAAHLVAARALVRLARLEEALGEAAATAGSPDASAEEIASAKLLEAEIHGRRGHPERFLALVEEVAATHPPGLVLLEALVRKARVLWGLGRYEDVPACVEEVRARLRELPAGAADRAAARLLADTYGIEGLVCWKQGHAREAAAAYEQALAIARRIGDRLATASTLNSMGALHRDLRADAQARAAFEEALAILREIGDRIGIAGALGNLGLVHREAGSLEASLAAHRESLAILKQTGDAHAVARGLKALSDALIDGGDFGGALAALEEALRLAQGAGDRGAEMLAWRNLGQAHAATGDGARAAEEFGRGLEMARAQDNPYNEAFILMRRGELHAAEGRAAEADRDLSDAVRVAEERRIPEILVSAHLSRARLRLETGAPDAVEDARGALAGAISGRNFGAEAAALLLLARVEAAAGSADGAREKLDRALALAPRCAVLLDRAALFADEACVRLALADPPGAARAAADGERLAREKGALPALRRLTAIRERAEARRPG